MDNVVHIEIQVVVLLVVGVGLCDVDRHCHPVDFLWFLLDDIGCDLWVLVGKPVNVRGRHASRLVFLVTIASQQHYKKGADSAAAAAAANYAHHLKRAGTPMM